MKEKCAKCGRKTILMRPAKYSPEDKFGKYQNDYEQLIDRYVARKMLADKEPGTNGTSFDHTWLPGQVDSVEISQTLKDIKYYTESNFWLMFFVQSDVKDINSKEYHVVYQSLKYKADNLPREP